jgi:predicted TIM-barrel fold metal-dependent hydrolase
VSSGSGPEPTVTSSARTSIDPVEADAAAALPIVSIDSHIGPRLVEDVRPYCPKQYLEQFDEFVASHQAAQGAHHLRQRRSPAYTLQVQENLKTDGHHDMAARLRDMDADGIAAAVIYHASFNNEPIPWEPAIAPVRDDMPSAAERDLMAVGLHIYNRWLADACLLQPERHVGCAQVPAWDIDATVREIEWAASAGLRSVNWPAPRPGILEHDEPAWEPVWSACEDLDMPLSTHSGAVVPGILRTDPRLAAHRGALIQLEAGGWPSRRGMFRMLFSGVFERHPKLKLVLTEAAGGWWPYTMREMDSTYRDNHHALRETLPKTPSEYCHSNVFIGASFIAPFEVDDAVDEGYSDNVLWGQDYPHPEGVWSYREDNTSVTRLHLRYAFCNAAPSVVQGMLSENAISVYSLERAALQRVAERINGVSMEEIRSPIDAEPTSYSRGFRKIGPWA